MFLARATAALLLLWSCTTKAAEWRGAAPGTTTAREVLETFGKPTRRFNAKGELVLSYSRKQAPKGTRAVQFRFTPEDELLRSIEVSPKPPQTRAALEQTLGPACTQESPPDAPCYEVQDTPDDPLSFHYASLGVEVRFARKRVLSLTYREPSARPGTPATPLSLAAPPPASAEPSPAADTSPASAGLAPVTIEDAAELAPPAVVSSEEPATSQNDLPQSVPILEEGESQRSGDEIRGILSMGGFYYQRAELTGARGAEALSYQPLLPSLADLYLDAKPSDSLRGFVRGRLLFDPLDPANSSPQVLLDQFWFQFGIAQRVFVTVGRQQLKWGSSRVWNPTDFLQNPNPTPLDAFDLRTGVDMVKVNIPWEALASSLWIIGTADLNGPADNRLRYGGAVRGEVTIGDSELAATAVFQQGRRPRYGLDWSMGLGPFDLNAEVALVRDAPQRLWERTEQGFVQRAFDGPKVLASGGAMATFRVSDTLQSIVRLEGFYNALGYDERSMLTWLYFNENGKDYRPLFLGRVYGLAQLTFTRRSVHEPSLIFTTLMNVSDPSYLGRVDFRIALLRDVTAGAFLQMPLGPRGGEFRFVPDPAVTALVPRQTDVEFPVPGLQLFRFGLNIRIRM